VPPIDPEQVRAAPRQRSDRDAAPRGVALAALAASDLAGNHYDVANASGTTTVLEPFPIGLGLVLTID
jgi:hypothetical protein